ncbi:putative T7SS-secreted protein [Streptomyces sp. NPDC002851]
MGRPAAHRWDVLDEPSDPIPGDPYSVAEIGRKMRDTADRIQKQAAEIKALRDVDTWKGKAADKYRELAEGAEDKLRKAFDRYDVGAKALGTSVREGVCSNEYASELQRAQDMADAALKRAEAADDEKKSAKAALSGQPDDTPKDDPQRKRQDERVEDADSALSKAKADLTEAKRIRDDAAKRAADAIREVIDNDGLKDSGWDKFTNWVSENADILKAISKWAGRIAAVFGTLAVLVNFIPVIGQALSAVFGAIALVAGIVSLASNLLLALAGEGSWVDVALDVVGVATFGIGRAAMAGARGAATGAKALARTKLFKDATARGIKAAKAWKIANKGSAGSPVGKLHRAAVDNLPAKPLNGANGLLEGLNPKSIAKETWDAGKSLVGKAELPNLSGLQNSLKNIAPEALADPKVADAVADSFRHSKIADAADIAGAGIAVSNTDKVDAWADVKDPFVARVGGNL